MKKKKRKNELASGIIIAGGKSRRLGEDKRWLVLSNKSLLETAIEKIRPLCQEIIICTAFDDKLKIKGVKIIHDSVSEKGPMTGLLEGLKSMTGNRALVIPCDLPFLTTPFLSYLLVSSKGYDITVPRWNHKIEPLVGVYRKNVIDDLEHYYKSGDLSLSRFVQKTNLRVRYVGTGDIRIYGQPKRLFFNINTPKDLALMKKLIFMET